MKTGKTYWGIEPVRERESRLEEREREVALVERGNGAGCLGHWKSNTCVFLEK
jgi:hypothetical protein